MSGHKHHAHHKPEARKNEFGKIFRWVPSPELKQAPTKVEIVGTFSHWRPLPMKKEISGGWHVTVDDIPSGRTHHYMLLVDGKPAHDKHSDGLTAPINADEEQYAITTFRGPRVFMLFAQTK
jgi:hypothetical protein